MDFTYLTGINPFLNRPWFLRVCSTNLLKTLREKEKLLVTSNFSFSHSVFYPFGELSAIFIKFKIVVCKLFQFGRVKNLSFGKGLNPQPLGVESEKLSSKVWTMLPKFFQISDMGLPQHIHTNPVADDKILALPKLKEFADDNCIVTKNIPPCGKNFVSWNSSFKLCSHHPIITWV